MYMSNNSIDDSDDSDDSDDDYDKIDTMTPEQLKLWKLEMLRKLDILERRGAQLHRQYNLDSDPHMMYCEYSHQTDLLQKQHTIDLFKTSFSRLIEEFNMTDVQIYNMLYCYNPAIHK